jgi:hypothetical protein
MNRDRIVKQRYEKSAELDKKVLRLERVHVNFRHRSNETHCEEGGKSLNNYYIYIHTHTKYIYIYIHTHSRTLLLLHRFIRYLAYRFIDSDILQYKLIPHC